MGAILPCDRKSQPTCDDDPVSEELGELVATYSPGHVARFAADGSLNVFSNLSGTHTAGDETAPMSLRLAALNRRNHEIYDGGK